MGSVSFIGDEQIGNGKRYCCVSNTHLLFEGVTRGPEAGNLVLEATDSILQGILSEGLELSVEDLDVVSVAVAFTFQGSIVIPAGPGQSATVSLLTLNLQPL